MLDTKIRGNVTELECMTAFVKEGYNVYIPFGEDSRFDFIGDVNGNLLRVQCKSCHEIFDDGEVIAIEFKTVRLSGSNATHYTRTQYTKDEIDYFATSYKGECYLVPVELCSNSKRLRFLPTRNNQTVGISFAKDYLLKEVVSKL